MSAATNKIDQYAELVREFPLRPIRTADEYQRATKILDRLAICDEGSLSKDEEDYLDVLTMLVADYDDKHHEIDVSHISPLDILKHLMEAREMQNSDLAKALGLNTSTVSMILNGKRALSKNTIQKLSSFFGVSTELFLPSDANPPPKSQQRKRAVKRARVRSS